MKVTSKLQVIGMRAFNDSVEGTRYDFTKFSVITDMDEGTGRARGQTAQEFEVGTSTIFESLKNQSLPFEIEADIDVTSNTKGKISMRILSFQLSTVKPVDVSGLQVLDNPAKPESPAKKAA